MHMPIYEYRCNACNEFFDCLVMKAADTFVPRCSKCDSTDVTKLVSRVRCMSGPQESGLAENAEKRLLNTLGSNVSDSTRKEVRELSREAARRGKKRFDNMMDSGKSENIDY